MKQIPRELLAAVVFLVCCGAVAQWNHAMTDPTSAAATSASRTADAAAEYDGARWRASEVARIRRHLALVEQELLAADVEHLTDAQRNNRNGLIGVLREYRERGIFPHNHHAAGRVPVFVDEHGTHCAVGYLLAKSGNEDLVRQIAGERNYAYVRQLTDIPELGEWLRVSGLTVAEAARIQPAYDCNLAAGGCERETGYPTATTIAVAIGGATSVWNLLADRSDSGWWVPGVVGVGSGVASMALATVGAATDDDDDDIRSVHILANAGIGLLAGALGVRTLRLGRATTTVPAGDRASRDRSAKLQLLMWAPTDAVAGVGVSLRF